MLPLERSRPIRRPSIFLPSWHFILCRSDIVPRRHSFSSGTPLDSESDAFAPAFAEYALQRVIVCNCGGLLPSGRGSNTSWGESSAGKKVCFFFYNGEAIDSWEFAWGNLTNLFEIPIMDSPKFGVQFRFKADEMDIDTFTDIRSCFQCVLQCRHTYNWIISQGKISWNVILVSPLKIFMPKIPAWLKSRNISYYFWIFTCINE